MKTVILLFVLMTFSGPLYLALSGTIDFHAQYQTANRESAQLAPRAESTPEAVIQVYAARAFNWRGMFATHTWIAVKPKNSLQYTVCQVVGWRVLRQLPALMVEKDIPDRNWFGQKPDVILDIRGDKAEKLIPQILQAVKSYPYPDNYELWPGPNSNTLPAYVARQVPALGLVMPANAIGKDFLENNRFFALAPSGTGYQFSLWGALGIMLAKEEGIEINILSFVYGIRFVPFAILLPGIGALPHPIIK